MTIGSIWGKGPSPLEKLGFFLLVYFFVLSSGCGHAEIDKEGAELHLAIGTSYLNNGVYSKALEELKFALSLHPSNPRILNNLGLTYFAHKKYKIAAQHLREALKIAPQFTDARNNLGRVLIEQQQFSAAIQQLEASLRDLTYETPEKSLFNLGIAYFKQGNFITSREYLLKGLKIDPKHCVATTYFGQALYQLKQYYEAADALDKAITYCQRYSYEEPYYFSGLAYLKLGELTKGRSRLDELAEKYPHGKYSAKAKSVLENIKNGQPIEMI